MESGCLMVGVDPGGEGSLPVVTVFRHELNGSYSIVKSFTGREAEFVYAVITGKQTLVAEARCKIDPLFGLNFIPEYYAEKVKERSKQDTNS